MNEEGSHPTDPEIIFSNNETDMEPPIRTVNAMRVSTNCPTELDTTVYFSDDDTTLSVTPRIKRLTKRRAKESLGERSVNDQVE